MILPIVLLLLAQAAFAGQQQSGKSSIEGVVLRMGTNEPVAGARVTVGSGPINIAGQAVSSRGGASAPTATTDSNGKFVLTDLAAGNRLLTFSAPGYVNQQYGQRPFSDAGTPITLRAGEVVKGLVMRLTPAGSLSGHVRDTFQQPIGGITVMLLKYSYANDGDKLLDIVGGAKTDDRGEYRLYWLNPGRYYLMALGASSGPMATLLRMPAPDNPNETPDDYATIYYPAVTDSESAAPVDVQPGVERGGLDFILPRQSLYHIRGRVIDAQTGNAQGPGQVSIQASSGFSHTIPYDKTGAFDIGDLIPLDYVLTVNSRAMGSVTVRITNSDVNGVVIPLSDPVSLSGRVITDGANLTMRSPIRVQLNTAGDGPTTGHYSADAVINQDGTFKLQRVHPGEYRISVAPLPQDSYLKEALFGGMDVIGAPLKLTGMETDQLNILLGSRPAQLDGVVTTDRLEPAGNVRVVLIPDRRDRTDLYRATTADASGRFRFPTVAPGDYKLFAWDGIEPNSWFHAGILKQYDPRGTPVHLTESGNETVNLKVIGGGAQ